MVPSAITAPSAECPQPFKSADGLGSLAVYGDSSAQSAAGSSSNAQRNTRYTYLVARLHNRQMTMEEATELFGLMDGMLRSSESARVALMRAASSPPAPMEAPKPRAAPPPSGGGGGSDDFFLLGILAMGAGAGLLAAMSRRLQELPPIAPPGPSSATPASAKSKPA
jgi:hypothetical protein